MRRGGVISNPPIFTGYPWESLQGLITAARILERAGLPIWNIADNAIYRAVYRLEIDYATQFGNQWKAEGDDTWQLLFIDKAYGSNFASNPMDPERLWKFGKIAGWGYVTLADPLPPDAPSNLNAVAQSGCEINLNWTDNADSEIGFKSRTIN